jgi:hypothetical protein
MPAGLPQFHGAVTADCTLLAVMFRTVNLTRIEPSNNVYYRRQSSLLVSTIESMFPYTPMSTRWHETFDNRDVPPLKIMSPINPPLKILLTTCIEKSKIGLVTFRFP